MIGFRNNLMVTAMRNSLILTVASVALIVLFAAMAVSSSSAGATGWARSSAPSCWPG